MPKSEIIITDNKVYHLGLKKDQLAPNIFLVGDPARCYKIAEHFDAIQHEVKKREFVTLTGMYQNQPMSVIGTGIGTDNVEIALMEMYTVLEFDFTTQERLHKKPTVNIIRVGTSGGVQADLAAGTMGIARYALGMDSTGFYYDHQTVDETITAIEKQADQILDNTIDSTSRFKGKIYTYASKASQVIIDALIHQAEKREVPYSVGITASSPGFYGPSARIVDGIQNTVPNIKHELAKLSVDNNRVINMEMESSLLFHLCDALSYRAGTICPIISNPYSSADLIDYDQTIRDAIELALGAMVEVINRPA